MRHILSVLFAAALLSVTAAEPPGFVFWKSTDLKSYTEKLAPKVNEKKFANEQIASWGNHSAMMVYRKGDGEAEVHEKTVDVFVVQEGRGTLVIGGKVVGGKQTGPGEIRGASIQGGVNKPLAPGDVVHIPANIAHQVLVAPGAEITYLILKVNM